MDKTFTVEIPGEDREQLLENARSSAEMMGATIDGDMTGGTFSGRGIEGRYSIAGDRLEVTILKKPALAPWPLIENIVKDFFS